ncbi:hypothetical protein ONZ45_g16859 [Pleurotus djamor]|nr:hypothetical protein ONZ45_g16859 [Pleurotus djamor]
MGKTQIVGGGSSEREKWTEIQGDVVASLRMWKVVGIGVPSNPVTGIIKDVMIRLCDAADQRSAQETRVELEDKQASGFSSKIEAADIPVDEDDANKDEGHGAENGEEEEEEIEGRR